MTTTYASYMQIANNLDRYTTMTSKETDVASATKYYKDNIGSIKSVDDFMNNDRVYRYAMKSFGLEDMTYAKAMVKKVLTEGVDDKNALANTLSDKRFLALAQAFDFKTYGDQTTTRAAVTTGAVDSYVRQTMESEQGEQNEGVELALYFSRKASSIDSPYDILADKSLIKVAQTALGLSEYTSYQDVDTQAKTLSKLIDFTDFQDPAKVQKFLAKFTAMYDAANPSASTSGSAAPSILLGSTGGGSVGISSDILTAIQGLKLGG
jgi:uncharacterized protein DUF1217